MTASVPGPGTPDRATIEAIRASDYLRRSPVTAGEPPGWKEWLHFVIHGDDGLELLVNFSVVDDTRPVARPGTEHARLIMLTRDPGWRGCVDLYDMNETIAVGGEVDLRMGESHARLREDGRIELRATSRDDEIAIDLVLTPIVQPTVSNNIRLELDDRPINWFVLPRLVANGQARLGRRTHVVRDAPAYHDHNWGHFSWGRDFAWEWGYALPDDPDDPWAVVLVRLSDRANTRTYTQGFFVWHREDAPRIFRGHDMRVVTSGFLDARPFRLPGVMNVLTPGSDLDVPATYVAEAAGHGDHAQLEFEAEAVAQVCIPNDTDHRAVTAINEVSGRLQLRGSVRGREIDFEGAGMFEFVKAGRS